MEQGSHGPLCVAVNAFIAGATEGLVSQNDGFIADDTYGERATKRMKIYRKNAGFGADGDCGSEARILMKLDGFDMEVAAHALDGVTVFVQPDGSAIAWCPRSVAFISAAPAERQRSVLDPDEAEALYEGLVRHAEARHAQTAESQSAK
jgi:hypothetical protein